jgi:hypothetical protein
MRDDVEWLLGGTVDLASSVVVMTSPQLLKESAHHQRAAANVSTSTASSGEFRSNFTSRESVPLPRF